MKLKLPFDKGQLEDMQDRIIWLQTNWRQLIKRIAKKGLKYGLIAMPVLFMVWQFTYSSDKMTPFSVVDGLLVGGQEKKHVIRSLDDSYKEKTLGLYISDTDKPFASPKTLDAGLNVSNMERIRAIEYPWYWKLVPTSVFWISFITDVDQPKYEVDDDRLRQYIAKEFGRDCRIEPVNPKAKVVEDKIVVSDGSEGGTCQTEEVTRDIAAARPTLTEETVIRLGVELIKPAITLADLEELVSRVQANLDKGVVVKVVDEDIKLDYDQVLSWLDIKTDTAEIEVVLDAEKASQTLVDKMAERLAKSAGVTKVTTHDFTEIARQDGMKGQEIDIAGTLNSVVGYLTSQSEFAVAATKEVAPRIEYTRTYSPTNEGLSALVKNYTDDKPGTYGVSLVELSGQRRSAGVNIDQRFTTASTYKVYVAYSVLRRIESGEYKWNNPVTGGRNLDRCFDDMIAQSDNPCAEALVDRIGYTPLHNDVNGLGLRNTSFIDHESFKTTAGDLSRFMAMLETGQLPINESSQTKLIEVLKRNVYRRGVPAGITGDVANKVGFLDRYLHDTAIIYSPKGAYVLTILTDGSSWEDIADLTRQIEALR